MDTYYNYERDPEVQTACALTRCILAVLQYILAVRKKYYNLRIVQIMVHI